MQRTAVVAILAALLAMPEQCLLAQQAPAGDRAPVDARKVSVRLYPTHFEADGVRFESIDELRAYLLAAPNDFFNIDLRDCAAKDRVPELWGVMHEVLGERTARSGKTPMPYDAGTSWPAGCARR